MMDEKYISIEAAIAEIKADAGCVNCYVKMPGRCLTCDIGRKIRRIEEIHPADVRPVVRGHWIGAYNDLKCSVCGKNWDELRTADGEDWGYWEDIPPYCPNCGAKMTGGTNE